MQGLSLKCLLLSFASLNLMLILIRLLTEYLSLNVPFHVGLQLILSLTKRLHLLKHLSLGKVKLCRVLHRLPLKQKNKRLNHLHRFLSLPTRQPRLQAQNQFFYFCRRTGQELKDRHEERRRQYGQ